MRRMITACLAAAASILLLAQLTPVRRVDAQSEQPAYRDPRLPVEQRVADLLGRMTLEEKVAQLESVWVTNQVKQLMNDRGEFAPDANMQELFKNGIGQFGGPSQAASDAEKATPVHGKDARAEALFVNSIQKYVVEHNRLGIPATFHEEALHGLSQPEEPRECRRLGGPGARLV